MKRYTEVRRIPTSLGENSKITKLKWLWEVKYTNSHPNSNSKQTCQTQWHAVISPCIPSEQDNHRALLTTRVRTDTHLEPETCSISSTSHAAICSAHYKRRGCTRAVAALCVHSGHDSQGWLFHTSDTRPWTCLVLGLEGATRTRWVKDRCSATSTGQAMAW